MMEPQTRAETPPRRFAGHREANTLLRDAARELPGLSPRERLDVRDRVLTYLRSVVEPCARVGDSPTRAGANADRLAIRDWIRQIAEVDLHAPEPLQELLYGLDALVRVHLWRDGEHFPKPSL